MAGSMNPTDLLRTMSSIFCVGFILRQVFLLLWQRQLVRAPAYIFAVYHSNGKIVSVLLIVSRKDSRRLVGLAWVIYPPVNKSLRPGLKAREEQPLHNLCRLRWRKDDSTKILNCLNRTNKQNPLYVHNTRKQNEHYHRERNRRIGNDTKYSRISMSDT